VAQDGPPTPYGLIADVVLDGAGVYLAAATATLSVRVRLARLAIPDLPVVPTGVGLTYGPIDGSLWQGLVARAQAALPHEVLLAVVARPPAEGELFVAAAGGYTLVEPQLDEAGTGDWQPQRASAVGVRATPIPDALLEVHSHHRLPAAFSATDDRDETARRVYGVLGRLDTPSPEVAVRVATGCAPHATEPVPFGQVFAGDKAPFRDLGLSPHYGRITVGRGQARLLLWEGGGSVCDETVAATSADQVLAAARAWARRLVEAYPTRPDIEAELAELLGAPAEPWEPDPTPRCKKHRRSPRAPKRCAGCRAKREQAAATAKRLRARAAQAINARLAAPGPSSGEPPSAG